MFFTRGTKFLLLTGLAFCMILVKTSSEECHIHEINDYYYSINASNSYGKLINSFESKQKEECRRFCCDLAACNFMMYSTVLRDTQRSTNTTCFLFNCSDISRCITKKLPANVTGISVVGIKQENFTETNLSSSYESSRIEQHKIYKPSMNQSSETHSPTSHVVQNTNHTLNTNKINNSNILKTENTTKLPHTVMHSQINSTNVTSNPITSINDTSSSTLSMSYPEMGNNTHPILPMITSSQISEIPVMPNHSLSSPLYPSISTHNANHSTLSMTSIRMHTPGNRSRSNQKLSNQVGSENNGSSPTMGPMERMTQALNHNSISVSTEPLTPSLKSNPDFMVNTSPSQSSSSSIVPSLSTMTPSPLSIISSGPELDHSSSSQVSNSSKGDRKTTKKRSEQHSHTTRVSLVISLIIGVLFFGTVVFLIGRRWSEQCFRRGYSRVDYLLNDYD